MLRRLFTQAYWIVLVGYGRQQFGVDKFAPCLMLPQFDSAIWDQHVYFFELIDFSRRITTTATACWSPKLLALQTKRFAAGHAILETCRVVSLCVHPMPCSLHMLLLVCIILKLSNAASLSFYFLVAAKVRGNTCAARKKRIKETDMMPTGIGSTPLFVSFAVALVT